MKRGNTVPLFAPALSLRVVISLSVIVGVVLTSALVFLQQSSSLREEYTAGIRVEMARLSQLTTLALREPLWQFVTQQADSVLEAVMVNPDVVSVSVVDDKGTPFAARSRPAPASDEVITLTDEVVRDHQAIGKLTITMSLEGYRAKLAAVRLQYARTALLIVAGSLVIILFIMQWRFVRPMGRLLAASRRLDQGHLDIPIEAGFRDELGDLAANLEQTRKSLLELVSKVELRNTELKDANDHLERRVAERTRSLETALASLQRAQQEMVQTEKLASLGRVVSGVAHELNTPIGNALLVSSTIANVLRDVKTEFQSGNLRRSTLATLVEQADTGVDIFVRNLERAAKIVGDFKQVAVDQTSDQRRRIDLALVTEEVLTTLNPSLRKANCEVVLQAEAALECDSFPGPYGQVLNNLVMNAIIHGFADRASGGTITIAVKPDGADAVCLSVADDGKGMTEAVRNRIYDPFFTTRLGTGGSGLGMNIVQGIVARILGGTIHVQSQPGQGTRVEVRFPRVAPSMQSQAAENLPATQRTAES